MTKVEGWMLSYENRINSALALSLPKNKTILNQAIRYSILSGGKRLRPLLVYLASEQGKAPIEVQATLGCAVEFIN